MNWKKLSGLILPVVVTALAGTFGYEKVQEYRSSQGAAVTVNVETGNNGELETIRRELRLLQAEVKKWHN